MTAAEFTAREADSGRLTAAMVAYLLTQARTRDLVEAVRAFQSTAGLTVDGKAGEKTQAALNEAMRPRPAPAPAPMGPHGLGLYARGWLLDPHALVAELQEIGASHVALQPAHVKRGAPKVLNAAGFPWRLFSTPAGDGNPGTPDSWLPADYGKAIPAFERIVLDEGGAGYLADTENGWPAAPRAMRAKLGHDLRASAERMREHGKDVGMTTFLSHPLRKELASICGTLVYCSTQLYEVRTAVKNAMHLADEHAWGWTVTAPSTAAYYHRDTLPGQPGGWEARPRTAAQWHEAYADFPTIPGTFVWSVGNIRGELAAEMKTWARRPWA